MEQVPDHPVIRSMERTGYPYWYGEGKTSPCLHCVKGGAERERGGGIVRIRKTIPQSPDGDSPLYTRGPRDRKRGR